VTHFQIFGHYHLTDIFALKTFSLEISPLKKDASKSGMKTDDQPAF
jgi:hypothetical protein